MSERTQEEIHRQVELANEQIDQNTSKYFGMTYEEGVRDALEWMTGELDEKPMEDE